MCLKITTLYNKVNIMPVLQLCYCDAIIRSFFIFLTTQAYRVRMLYACHLCVFLVALKRVSGLKCQSLLADTLRLCLDSPCDRSALLICKDTPRAVL